MSKTLYNHNFEKDSCGIGLYANINGVKEHQVVRNALAMLERMEHRGATGADPSTGDGAGILFQIPHNLFLKFAKAEQFQLPQPGQYGVAMVFFPQSPQVKNRCKQVIEQVSEELELNLMGYRKVPVDSEVPGADARKVEPYIEQLVLTSKKHLTSDNLERRLFILKKYVSQKIIKEVIGNNDSFYICSCSSRTIVYKGQLRTNQLKNYYFDLQEPEVISAFALVHSRFSTNTFPNWKLAQPFQYIAHNGEINTIRGNVNKMHSKEARFESRFFSEEDFKRILPVTDKAYSDSANLDALVEMLTLAGRSLPHVLMMLIPEAWQDNKLMDHEKKAFYKYHASLMEPWDGPAAILFSNGKQIGAATDRNGLRPVRYTVTHDDVLILASETGTFAVPPEKIASQGRLQPGKMLMLDVENKKLLFDEEVKRNIYRQSPYYEWIKKERIKLRLLPDLSHSTKSITGKKLRQLQISYGYDQEAIEKVLIPMARAGKEPVGSMGADAPLPFLSHLPQHISNYFRQFFAQVSNPPIDPIRERGVMSLFTRLGESLNILDETPEHTRQIHISQPVLTETEMAKIQNLANRGFTVGTIEAVITDKNTSLKEGLERICTQAEKLTLDDKKILIISNRRVNKSSYPIPSLLAIGAIHHYLVSKRLRTKVGLVLESGDIWETHHFATAIGYGASAVHPFMVFETLRDLNKERRFESENYVENYVQSIGGGLLKIMSKMGISTLQSYQSAQIFECIGLSQEVVDRCFKGTISRIEGLTFQDLEKEILFRHQYAYQPETRRLTPGGYFQWKRNGERHLINPETVHLLQKSVKLHDYELFKKYAEKIDQQREQGYTLRGLFGFRKGSSVPIEEVEPVESIFQRFCTGAMSFGSLSHEAHSTLAIAMNRIGGKSNSGEGGEDEARYVVKENGDSERSAIKQVASGRFGVTSHYLSEADEIQIKMAQGAKPGEGGQLPGHKVDNWIARVRHSTPGVGLISPPPHHDIYSIEDLKQLIYDLKNANRHARINVKLVSESGVGTIAAGVAKAKADVIMISGYDGGTGASPLSSIRYTGLPWEMGLSEAHQTLVKNDLRNRVTLQVDGKIMTGRDIAVATLLGAEEWGVATAALIAEGCIMMRKCHLNTCPVGVATQRPELRQLFTGDPQHVIHLFEFMARQLREIMAEMGFRTINEMVGQAHRLKIENLERFWKSSNLDLTPIIYQEHAPSNIGLYKQVEQDFELENVLDRKLISASIPALDFSQPIRLNFEIRNTDRSVGAMLSHEVSKRFGKQGMIEGSIHCLFKGQSGQSFAAFLAQGITFELVGEANDYLGKGLSGGKVIVYPDQETTFDSSENTLIGNVAFYGATSGTAYIRGQAGERFCVRNSGVTAVVEGIGDHGCEYMTGGRVIVLGSTGKNFAAGMSGGIAYVFDTKKDFTSKCNMDMVALEPLSSDDEQYLITTIEGFINATGSKAAKDILENWYLNAHHFIKVIPYDYKRVLEEKNKELEEVI